MEQQNGTPAALPGEFKHWKRRTALFLTGQTISLFGSSLVQFAIIWYITLTTQSGTMMTVATVCGFAPQVAVSLFSGVWADRIHRKRLIIAADALVASATLILALFFLSGHNDLWMVFLVSGVRSLGSGIQTPAVNAVIPQIVPPDKIIRIGGINGSLQSVMFLLSPAASGAILSIATIESTFFIDVVTAAIAIFIMALLKLPVHEKAQTKQKGGYMEDLKKGIRYVAHSSFFRAFFIFFALFMFFVVPPAQLLPLMVTRTFGNEVWRLSLAEVCFSAGSVLGGVVIAAWGGFKNRTFTIAMGFFAFGLFTILVGVSGGFVMFLVTVAVCGLTMPFVTTPAMALLQEQVDANMQGRVFSLVQIVMTAVMPLGMAVFGPIADRVSVEALMILSGVVVLVLSIFVVLNRHLRRGVIAD